MKTARTIVFALVILIVASTQGFCLSTRDIAKKAFPSVVLLVLEDADGQPISLGSGFFIAPDVVATNRHVIENAKAGYAKIIGKRERYQIAGTVGIDAALDLALVKLEGAKAPPLKIGNSANLAVGDEVYAVGNPLGLEGTFSMGILSGIRRIKGESVFQVTAPISPGSSGGPMLNKGGNVIGVAVATFRKGQNLNFAIPAFYLSRLVKKTGNLRPLSGSKQQKASVFNSLGKKSIDGMVCDQFLWNKVANNYYSFSLRNRLSKPVEDIVWMAIYYDKTGKPIDFYKGKYRGIIPPKLAKRVDASIKKSVRELLGKPVELRIIDFKIADEKKNSSKNSLF